MFNDKELPITTFEEYMRSSLRKSYLFEKTGFCEAADPSLVYHADYENYKSLFLLRSEK